MISVVIPVYREAPLLDSLISDLKKDEFKDKEIIVSIDEPTELSTQLGHKYAKSATFIFNKKRVGKAKALNDAFKKTKGDTLLFLDSDVKIISKNFLSRVNTEIKGMDILDMKKTIIRGNRISKLANYEFMAANLLTLFFGRMKKCLGLNGSAFAIKRETFKDIGGFREGMVSEDLELGIQSYLKNKSYKYCKDIEISTKAKETWKEWFVQRKRWSVGGGQFFKYHWKVLSKAIFKHPYVAIMTLFFTWPMMFSSLIYNTAFENFLLISLFSLSLKFSFLFPIFLFTGFGFLFIKNLVVFFITYVVSSVLFYIASRKLKFTYNIKDFTLYYFFYSPLWFSIFFYNFVKTIITSEIILSDWKYKKRG